MHCGRVVYSEAYGCYTTYPALIVGAPYGGVKEQGPGVYANELAQRGFVVLTFDQFYGGFSR